MNQQLIKSLLIEIDASTEKMRRALREGGVELDTFAQKSERSGKTSSTAADAVTSKQANAARAIAMTTETIARQGQVSGETAKQLIAQGSNVAFMFGPAGAIVGAIGIATLAIVGMFARTKREAEETARTARDEFRKLSDMDLVRVSSRLQQLDTGDYELRQALAGRSTLMTRDQARAYARDDWSVLGAEGLREERARLTQQLGGLGTNIVVPIAEQNAEQRAKSALRRELEREIKAIDETMEQLQPRLTAAKALYERRAAEQGERAAGDLSLRQDEERRKRTREQQAEDDKLKQSLSQQSQAAQEALLARFNATLRNGFAGTRADIEQSFAELVQYASEHGEQSDIAFLKKARQQALDFIEAAERSQALMEDLERSDLGERMAQTGRRERGGAQESQLSEIERQRDEWLAFSQDVTRSEQDRAKALAEAVRLQGLLEARLARGVKERKNETKELRQQALVVGQAIDGVLQLAAAWGNVRAEVVNVLRGVVQMASNVPGLLESLSSLRKARDGNGSYVDAAGNVITTAAAAGSVAAAALPIIGALSTIGAQLLGDSPEEAARREELRRNTEAIRELTARAGLLGTGVVGGDAAAALPMLQGFLRRVAGGQIIAGGRTYSASDQATIAAERLGILDDLQKIAAQYGITLNRNITSFEQLLEAIQDTITKLGEFGTDLDSALQQANAEAEIFGITDPLERLGLTQGAYRGRSPILDQLTAGLDLSTAEGRARARENAQDLFNILKAGGDTLSADQLGGLTGQQLLDAILQLVSGLNDIDAQVPRAEGSSLGGVSGFRGLTEAAGERMADYLKAILGQGSEHLQVLRAQLAELSRIAATPFTLPVIPGVTVPMPAGAGGTTITLAAGAISMGDIVVQVNGSTTDPTGLGLQVTRAVRDQVEELLYQSVSRALRARGDVSIIPGVR